MLSSIRQPLICYQIDISVNAPTSGKIVKLLAAEEDTVTIGQDLFVIEPGEVQAGESAASPPKDETEPADQQVDKSLPKPPPPSESDKKSSGISQPPPQESKKEPKEKKSKQKEKETTAERPVSGSRNETRVRSRPLSLPTLIPIHKPGQDEPHAPAHR